MSQEQRVCARVPYSQNVLLDDAIMVKGIDISEGGLYVHTGRSCNLECVVKVKFTIKGREIVVKAQVKSCHDSIGMGLNFVDLTDEYRDLIRAYSKEYGADLPATVGKKLVLLVEDNETTRRMNKSRLVLDGYSVIEACDGCDAIRRLSMDMPDIIVLDLYMEKMDGYKVLAYIKGDDVLKKIPTVVLSSRAVQTEINKAMSYGADGFLAKMTTSPAKLSEYIGKMLK